MGILWLMPSWSAPSELWMQRMLRAVEDRLAYVACYEPKAPAYGERRVPVIDLGRRADPASIERGRESLRAALASPAVTHVMAHYPPFALRYDDVLRAAAKPVFVHCHGYDITWDLRRAEPPHERVHAENYPKQVRELAQWAMLIANSHATAAKLSAIDVPASRIVVKYLGVPIPQKARWELPDDGRLKILFLGRLIECKGPNLLLRAFEIACQRGLDAELIIAGDGPCRAMCESIRDRSPFRHRIQMLGAVDDDTGRRLREAAHIYSTHNLFGPLTRQEEAYGVAMVEAMASGLAIVSTRNGSIPELIEDGRSGLLVEPGDVETHVEALLRVARDGELRRSLGYAARERAIERFSDVIERDHLRRLLGE